MHVATIDVDRLASQQTSYNIDRLAERGEWRGGAGADLAHPALDAVPDTGHEAARMQAGQRRELHRQHSRIAHDRRGHTDPDRDPFGDRQSRRGRCDAAGPETVLDEPELVESEIVDQARERDQPLRR